MPRVQFEVVGLEFEEDGNTIWVHGQQGTILRVQCTGKIRVAACPGDGATPHADVRVHGDIAFCVPKELEEGGGYVH